MSVQELERLTKDLNTNAKLRDQLKLLGHDTGAFVKIANGLGYKFDENDLNAYIVQKQAQISREKAAQLAAGVGVTSTVAVVKTGAAAVTTGVGVTKVGGAVIAVEVAVVT
jgi:predicted ribosomally synthesized peptide with nif11-like leader